MRSPASFRFKPFSHKQKKLLTWWMEPSPYRDWDMVIADGSVRSGKTIAMIDGFITWSLAAFEDQAFIIAGKTVGALTRNVIRPMLAVLRAKGIAHSYHRSENYIEIGRNTYYCFGANNEASQDTLQGLTAAGALADEAALFPWSFVEQMIARCSVDGAKLWLNCNPESPHHPVKTELIDKAGEKRIVHLHFTMDDNLTLSRRVKDRFRRMFSGVWFKRYILGLWVAAEGAIYDMLDETVHVVDTLPRILRHWVGCDYGPGSVTTFWLLGEGEDNRLYFVDFWRHDVALMGRQKSDVEISRDLISWLDTLDVTPREIIIPSDAMSLMLALQGQKSGTSRIRGLAWADRSPGSVLRGIQSIGTLLSVRRLLFSRDVARKGGLAEWSGYVWDPAAQARGDDSPLKKADHNPDAGRYAVEHVREIWSKWLRG